MKKNYNFDVVKLHLKFNQRTKSTPHKFQTRFPSQNLILFQPKLDLRKGQSKMLKTFITSFKLQNTYRTNSIIYSIKQLPIIRKILPNSLYKNRGLKIFANIISILWEIISIFIGKLIYISAMIFLALSWYKTNQADTFIHLFVFLTLAGGVLNTYMLNPTKDKYYAIILMNMNAREYGLSNYYYQLIKLVIGFLPFTIIFGMIAGAPLWVQILLPFYILAVKLIVMNYCLYKFKNTNKATSENLPTKIVWSFVGICLILAYGLPALGITINSTIFLFVSIIAIILGIYSLVKIHNFKDYRKMYKQVLTETNVYMQENATGTQAMKDNSLKQIELDTKYTSNKTGFAYFHDLFVKRHKKILTEAVKKQSVVILVIITAMIIGLTMNDSFKTKTNEFLLAYLPYFVFIMYLINRSSSVTQAMFMNCDHSMLTYRIYRTPKVILGIFKERLKTLITINLLPAFLIGGGLALLLYLSGGTDNPVNYAILFISIISMSIFFSVHYLVMYYLLQPYNVSTEMKSSTYKVVQGLTYIVSYYMIQIKLPIFGFGIATIVFCIAYSLISLFLAYKYAPKTFKLRV